MGRTARDTRERQPNLPPVEKIELDARHTKVRLALTIFFLVLGVVLIGVAISGYLRSDAGWAEIECISSDLNCSEDFTFIYPLGYGGTPTTERKLLEQSYSDACVGAYRLFNSDEEFDGINNLHNINRKPNERLLLNRGLYHAFEQIIDSGDRSLYLAPIHEVCNNIFYCETDAQTADYDPRQNTELAEWCREACVYASDPEHIQLVLLEDNYAMLQVSDEYMAFAQSEEIGRFIDFGWMRNAFIADYIAAQLSAAGCKMGTISSDDGYMVNLDEDGETDYGMNLFDRQGQNIMAVGTLHYSGSRSMVSLRDFPLNSDELDHYYIFDSGDTRNIYYSPEDGLCRAAVPSLAAWSDTAGCAKIALKLAPIYIADALDTEALNSLHAEGIDTLYIQDGEICSMADEELTLTDVAEGYTSEVESGE